MPKSERLKRLSTSELIHLLRNSESVLFYLVNPKAVYDHCGHRGAIQSEGKWYPEHSLLQPPLGPGGTIPWVCTNCGNRGLINMRGLEGFEQAFTAERLGPNRYRLRAGS